MTRPSNREVIRDAAESTDHLLRAADLHVHPSAMARMEQQGVIDRVAPGIYVGAEHVRHPLIEAAAWSLRYPAAVAGLLTAARYHELTDAFPRGTWLCVPKGTAVPRSRHAPLHVVQIAPRFIDPEEDAPNGITRLEVHGVPLRITNPDRTVLDLWRYPRRIPSEYAFTALRRRTRADDFEFAKFARLARRLGTWRRIVPVLQGMVAR